MNKGGYSTGFGFIVAITIIIVAGIFFIILDQAFTTEINPVFTDMVNSTVGINGFSQTDADAIYTDMARWQLFWKTVPIIIIFLMVIYLIVNAVRSKRQVEE